MKKSEYKDDYYEDRINLYDYIQVIWRWKFIIVGIIIMSVIAALLISFTITPVYRVSASLSPGAIEELNKETMKVELVPVDSIDDIVAYINGGIYNPKIFNSLNLDPFGLQFIAKKPEDAYIINVYYDTTDPAQGEVLVKELLNQIEKSYSWKITSKKNEILNIFKKILDDIVFYINNIKLLKDAEKKMIRQIKTIEINTEAIRKQRDRLLSEGGEGDPVALLLYSNTIQQNIEYKDTINKALQDNRRGQEAEQNKHDFKESEFINEFLNMEKYLIKSDIAHRFTELLSKYEHVLEKRPSIKHLLEQFREAKIEEEAADVKLIRVVQEPFASFKPININRKRMVMISGFSSLFLGFFLALIADFIRKNKASSNQS